MTVATGNLYADETALEHDETTVVFEEERDRPTRQQLEGQSEVPESLQRSPLVSKASMHEENARNNVNRRQNPIRLKRRVNVTRADGHSMIQ